MKAVVQPSPFFSDFCSVSHEQKRIKSTFFTPVNLVLLSRFAILFCFMLRILPLILLVIPMALLADTIHAASTPVLSQIQIIGDSVNDEYIELWNPSDTDVNLFGWSIRKKTKGDTTAKGTSLKTFSTGDTIPVRGYFLWTNTKSIFSNFSDTTTATSLTDDNSVALFDKNGNQIDALTWGAGHTSPFALSTSNNPIQNECLLRNTVSLAWELKETCAPKNRKGETWLPPEPDPIPNPSPIMSDQMIRMNEVFPNPLAKGDLGEFIELFNSGDATVDLSNWIIHDATKTGKYTFSAGVVLAPQTYLVLTDQDFTFSLNNSNETLTLFDARGAIIHSVSYTKTKEGVSLNLVRGVLRGAKEPTPGALNSENTEPTTRERVPKKGYRGFALEFRARGSDDDGDKLKFTWDFGDNHKSYKEKTTHKYTKTGKYTILLMTDDGSDTVTETFEITIQKYEPPKLHITALMPNPEGKDTEGEWIEIENREKKSINLKDFSIATGTKSKKLTNHPIREDLTLPAKSKRKITRENSLFTLGNQKGYTELRAPDGSSISKLKYKFETGLADNVILKKEKGKKLTPETPGASAETQPEVTPSNIPISPVEVDEINQEIESQEVILDHPDTTTETPETPNGIVLGASTNIPSDQTQDHGEASTWPRLFASFSEWLERLNEKLNLLFLTQPEEHTIF